MVAPLAFSTVAFEREVIKLADGRIAERSSDRKGRSGWLVYGLLGNREAFYTDREWAKRGAR
jgi:hypothetical protein